MFGSNASHSLLRCPCHHLPDSLRLQIDLIDLRSLRSVAEARQYMQWEQNQQGTVWQRLIGWAIRKARTQSEKRSCLCKSVSTALGPACSVLVLQLTHSARWQGGCQPADVTPCSGLPAPGGNMLPCRSDVMDFQGTLLAEPLLLGAGALAAFWPAAGAGWMGVLGSVATTLGAEAWLALLEEGPPKDDTFDTVGGLTPLPRGTMEYSMRLGVPSASTLPLTCRAARRGEYGSC